MKLVSDKSSSITEMEVIVNSRTNKILTKILVNEKKRTTFSELAIEFKVSERTIRNDIQTINDFMSEQHLSPLQVKSNGEIFFEGTRKERELITSMLQKSDYYAYKLSPEERYNMIILSLLNAEGYLTIAQISDKLLVSRGTVISDMEAVKIWLLENGLSLESYQNKGFKILGQEEKFRKSITKLIGLNDGFSSPPIQSGNVFKYFIFNELYNDVSISQIENIIKEVEEEFDLIFTDIAYNELLYYLAIVIKRLKINKYTESKPLLSGPIKHNTKYQLASSLMQKIEISFSISYTDSEVAELTQQLLSKSFISGNISTDENVLDLQIIVNEFIRQVSKCLMINIQSDYQLYEYLINHIEATSYRVKQQNVMINPLRKRLELEYGYLFSLIEQFILPLEKYIGHKMDKDELSYIVMHIGAAIERQKMKVRPLKVIVVCNTGLGTAQFLVAKLKQHFILEIVEITSSHNLEKVSGNVDFDLVISTVPIKNIKYPIIHVDPIITEENIYSIQKYLSVLRDSKIAVQSTQMDVKDLVEKLSAEIFVVTDKYIAKDKVDKLKSEIKSILNENFKLGKSQNNKYEGKAFSEIITEELIALDINAEDWKDALKKGGSLLVEQNKITIEYIDAMITTIEKNGAYIVVAPGVAIPHAAPIYGAKDLSVSIIRLKNPVSFGHEKNDPVEFIICLSVLDSKSHLKAFFSMMNMICNKEFIKSLQGANSPREILNIIRYFENIRN
jgi:transcriptional antiterminator/mannitol/fructose-specific phosphotransferase system IIA component (Ntr-type)